MLVPKLGGRAHKIRINVLYDGSDVDHAPPVLHGSYQAEYIHSTDHNIAPLGNPIANLQELPINFILHCFGQCNRQ